jgi:glycine dehydrogenase subunit 1
LSRYTSATDADREQMLATIGVGSVEELFRDIPEAVRMQGPLDIPDGKPEQEVYAYLRALAEKNVSTADEISFAGGGMYDHYIPALVEAIALRSEFLTPYTPYQPEVSQGTLQVMFEYQTAISELTGLPVSNASVYEGPSAVAAAGYLAKLHHGRERFVVSAGLHPHSRETLNSHCPGYGMTMEEVPLADGVTDLEAFTAALSEDVSAVVLQQPNYYGAVEDLEALVAAAHAVGALVIVQADPIALSVLKAPGDFGVDVVVGEGQPLGNRLDFGGPSFGFFAAQEAFIRRMPGRIVGATTDVDGRPGYVLTLQTREQHIRREKATSNICTAQALNALMGTVYLSWLGREGFQELGQLLLQRTAYARETLAALDGVELWHEQPVVREFALQLEAPVEDVIERCAAEGVNPGLPLEGNCLLVAITEQRSKADIDTLARVLGEAVAALRTTAAQEVTA